MDPSRIVFANPCKAVSALCVARDMGVVRTTFDNLDELDSIKRFMPNAELFLRIHANDDGALIQLGDKFGASVDSTLVLLQRARELGLEVVGVSFHVGMFQLCWGFDHIADNGQAPGQPTTKPLSKPCKEQKPYSTKPATMATICNIST